MSKRYVSTEDVTRSGLSMSTKLRVFPSLAYRAPNYHKGYLTVCDLDPYPGLDVEWRTYSSEKINDIILVLRIFGLEDYYKFFKIDKVYKGF